MYIGSSHLLQLYDQTLLNKGYTIVELIDKASDCLYDHFDQYKNIGLLVGPGNNGGDALSLAIKLYQNQHQITLFYIGDINKNSVGNQHYFNECIELSIPMIEVTERILDDIKNDINNFDVIGDGLFGFGLNKTPAGLYQRLIDIVNKYYTKDVIAIDIPTGLNCNTGQPYSTVLFASKTVSLTALKEGFLNPESQIITGEIIIEELDVENVFIESGLYELIDETYARSHIKERLFDGYKNLYGNDLLIVGSAKYKGAAFLSAKATQYSGAGLVHVMSDEEVNFLIPTYLPEVIVEKRPSTFIEEVFNPYDAILIGCGLGMDMEAHQLLIEVLEKSHCPLVIDADGLNILSKNIRLLRYQDRPIILTPHIGEFKRLTEVKSDDDLMDKAIEFAKENNVILVLKGPYTIVTNGEENYRIASGNKAMSVAGMGDTLAGIITSFLGQSYDPMTATLLAVYLHGFTGDLLAKKRYTVIPELLSENLPQAMYLLTKKDEN